jgi:Tol biopolymer transport system component/predicted Ser/Thr protein kinase
MSLSAGERLGPYEILSQIGAGGMGEVYLAKDTRLGREVAIKTSNQQFTERFEREARAIASLNHPNICGLFDVGPNFLVMEYVEGEAPKGPLPLEEALRIAKQIAEALGEAHEKGITHRDLKPANIKIKPDGTVKVLDFGLAKLSPAREGASSDQAATQSPTLSMAATQAGMILGTAAYMAPEQAKGKPVDRRADIWAFGVVVHELLTGRRMFEGEDVTETMAAVVLKEPQWDGVPVEVRRLLKKCLEKDPKKRLRDIGDAWELLEAPPVAAEAPAAPGLVRQGGDSLVWIAATVIAVGALAALAFLHFRETPPAEHILSYTLAPPDGVQNIHSFAVSPDGRTIVMAAAVNGKQELWQRPLDALQWRPMPSTDGAAYPFWSPDSRNIAFFAGGKLRRIAASGGPSQPICDAPDGRSGSWNRDDVIVFSPAPQDTAVQRVPAGGGVPQDVTKTKGIYRFPKFLPDGRRFLYLVSGSTPEKNGIYVSSLDGTENRRVLADSSSAEFALSAAGGRLGQLIFIRENTLMAQPFDSGTAQLSGDVFPVGEGVTFTNVNNFAPVTASGNGVLLYWTGGGGGGGGTNQIVWYDRAGKLLESVVPLGRVRMPAISPDEKTIAFSRGDTGSANRDIILRDLSRQNDRRLTTDASTNTNPSFSPHGDRIVFVSSRGGHLGDLYWRASNGSGQDEVLLSTSSGKIVNQWSRDGRFIVYAEQDPKTKWDVSYLPMGEDGKPSGKPMPFAHSEFNEVQGQLSPDSRWMAYTSDVSGQREVYVQPFPSADNELRISTAGGVQPRWRGDGKELFYVAPDGKLTAVAVTVTAGPKPSVKAGAPVALFDTPSSSLTQNFFSYDVTADGKRFLVDAVPSAASSAAPSTPPLTVRINWTAASEPRQ